MSIGTIWTYRDVIKREQGLEAAIEFEQVVKKYQAEQIDYERERIIKLLEEYLSAFGAPQEQLMQRRMVDAIALIKGENK